MMTIKHLSYLALGAGRQSTALFLMWAHRDPRLVRWCDKHNVPWPYHAVFADPGHESPETYGLLWRLAEYAQAFPDVHLHVVTKTDAAGRAQRLGHEMLTARRFSSIPAYTLKPSGAVGMLRRNCTQDYKIRPIHRWARRLLRVKSLKGRHLYPLLGIGRDEPARVKPGGEGQWEHRQYPLFDLGIDTDECQRINAAAGFTDVEGSACVFCPYKDGPDWQILKARGGQLWADVVAFDAALRNTAPRGGVVYPLFLHRSCVPIDEAIFDTKYNWDNDCAGLCGI